MRRHCLESVCVARTGRGSIDSMASGVWKLPMQSGVSRRPTTPSPQVAGHPTPLGLSAVYLHGFVIFEFVCQIALLFDAFDRWRILIRSAAFGGSLFLAICPAGGRRLHPASRAALAVLVVLVVSLAHPTTNSLTAGVAQIALYAAILAPLVWVARVRLDLPEFSRLIRTMWAFQVLSALTGVLQVYFPGEFQGSLSSVIRNQPEWYLRDLSLTVASGARILRPMGLTDTPGGAAHAGLYAVLFGIGLLASERRGHVRLVYALGMTLGLFCIYLSQVRVVLVMTGICVLVYFAVLALRGSSRRFAGVLAATLTVILVSSWWAFSFGGEAVTKRVASLTEAGAGQVYYSNRGHFLENTITVLLPEFPLGAGLGRWGMMYYYFGDKNNPLSQSIWAEIQWTAWLLDGGIPLIAAYVTALALAGGMAWRFAFDKRLGHNAEWAALIFAYNIGAFAVTFSHPLFLSQTGLDFWLLNAALFAACQAGIRRRLPVRLVAA